MLGLALRERLEEPYVYHWTKLKDDDESSAIKLKKIHLANVN